MPTWDPDESDPMARAWKRHERDCRIKKAGIPMPFEGAGRRLSSGFCCEQAMSVHGTCVCAYVLCCPQHGHQHVGTHD